MAGLCVGLAFVGTFVPGIPTTIFLIVALWAFAKSSKKFHSWLLNHKRFGPILQNWESHKVVPRKAKILMVILQISAVIIFPLLTSKYLFNSFINYNFGFCGTLCVVASKRITGRMKNKRNLQGYFIFKC